MYVSPSLGDRAFPVKRVWRAPSGKRVRVLTYTVVRQDEELFGGVAGRSRDVSRETVPSSPSRYLGGIGPRSGTFPESGYYGPWRGRADLLCWVLVSSCPDRAAPVVPREPLGGPRLEGQVGLLVLPL